MSRRVLIVDDDELVRWSLLERLNAEGYDVMEAATAIEALEHAEFRPDLVLLDYKLPDADGITVLNKLRSIDPDVLVMMLTPHHNMQLVFEAMNAGAFDYAAKPLDLDEVAVRVSRAVETTRLRRELRMLRDTLAGPYALDAIVGESEAMQRVKNLVRRIASSPGSTVLITGESGTGKTLIAKIIHYCSQRADRPFLTITSSALPDALLESEMFGHERDAFPDARHQKRGLLEQADEGTVFLDEIGELTPALQAKLLRFLEEKTFRRIGGASDIHVDVRVTAATTRNLGEQVRQSKFRDDLYYRLNVLRVELPALRTRTDDIGRLAQHFVNAFAREFNRPARTISPAAEAALNAYAWPGNVRELRNLVERAVLLSGSPTLEPADFEPLHTPRTSLAREHGSFSLPVEGVELEQVEKSLVIQALERAGGNQTHAATLLGLHRDQIRYRIDKFGLAKK